MKRILKLLLWELSWCRSKKCLLVGNKQTVGCFNYRMKRDNFKEETYRRAATGKGERHEGN
ncbi:MAG: hypothetical protein UC708_06655 [Anaerovoracaceae bacterium]|nr:hypothetical protein [Bacillota bacterium]MEE0517544.1 hypothetical protein [Anaerovoracaceae bacterium]